MNALKYPVLTTFRDKHTKIIHREGTQYKTNDEKRAEELQALGFIGKPLNESAPPDVATDAPDNIPDNVEEWPKSAGGGYWDLPNGERVRGKENALKALAELNGTGEGGDSDDEQAE